MMSAPSMVQVGAQMHPGMQGPPGPPPNQAQLQQQIEAKYDNVNKVKSLIWSLKDSFGEVMKVAGARVNHLAAGKTNESPTPRFDKTLEDFFSICNQIEVHLKTIQEATLQQKDSASYLPFTVTQGKQDVIADGHLSYNQYISTVKAQVAFARSIQDIVQEGVRKISIPE